MKFILFALLLLSSLSISASTEITKKDYEEDIKLRVKTVGKALCQANFSTTDCSKLTVTLKEIFRDDVHISHKAVIKIRHEPKGPVAATMTFIINDGRIMAIQDQCHMCG